MSGVRLEVEVHLVTGAVTSVQNVIRSVNRAGLSGQDIVLAPLASAGGAGSAAGRGRAGRGVRRAPLASAGAVVSAEEKELGILLIDLGGGTTDVALFRDDAVWYTGILPLGGDHISKHIAGGLRAPP